MQPKNPWKVVGMICLMLPACSVLIGTKTATSPGMDTPNPKFAVATLEDNFVQPFSTNTENISMTSPHVNYYGVVYPYPGNEWDESERPAIRQRLMYLHSLGINTVIQVFSSKMIATGTQQNWLIFLDEAQRLEIQVVARLYPSNEGSGETFTYQLIDEFLSVVRGHPALLAYLGLHEPLEQFRSEQLQKFYRHIKAVAPSMRVAHYLDDMAAFDNSSRFPGRRFSSEICDICIIWYYPAIYENASLVFDVEHEQKMVQANRALVDERSPHSELWFLGQAYSSEPDSLRMPTPDEMETIFDLASREGVDGFLWYPWLHDQYQKVLDDPDMELQREAVRNIYETYILPSP